MKLSSRQKNNLNNNQIRLRSSLKILETHFADESRDFQLLLNAVMEFEQLHLLSIDQSMFHFTIQVTADGLKPASYSQKKLTFFPTETNDIQLEVSSPISNSECELIACIKCNGLFASSILNVLIELITPSRKNNRHDND